MSMDAHDLAAFVWLVQKYVVWSDEFPVCECFDADTEDFAIVNREWVGILDFESRDAGAGAV